MELLQQSLDDPSAQPCGRCSVCRGALPEGLTERPDPATVARVTALLRGEVHRLEPRKMWPGGAFGSRGRIPAEEQPAEGRVLALADAPEWRDVVREMTARDAEAPAEVLEACVRLMTAWRSEWPSRPEVVVGLPAAGFGRLTRSVAEHLAQVGRLERADIGVPGTPPPSREASGAEEAVYWRDGLQLDGCAELVRGRTVLLVVDATSSLWPVTVAAAGLRRRGAEQVLPLLLHRRP